MARKQASNAAPPSTKLEVAQYLAEMMATPGWHMIFIPSLERRRDQVLKSILEAPDPTRNFGPEIGALKVLNMIIGAKGANDRLLAVLQQFSATENPVV